MPRDARTMKAIAKFPDAPARRFWAVLRADVSLVTESGVHMATSLQPRADALTGIEARAVSEIRSIPWYVWSLFAAGGSVVVGGYWDISWHMSIGRDSFWTPAPLAIQLCGIISG